MWLLGSNDALDFERWLGEAQDQPGLTAGGPEVAANHREVDILNSADDTAAELFMLESHSLVLLAGLLVLFLPAFLPF